MKYCYNCGLVFDDEQDNCNSCWKALYDPEHDLSEADLAWASVHVIAGINDDLVDEIEMLRAWVIEQAEELDEVEERLVDLSSYLTFENVNNMRKAEGLPPLPDAARFEIDRDLAKERDLARDVVKRLVLGCPDCTQGWVHYQAPMKPAVVIGHSEPCQSCNADKAIPLPSEFMEMYVSEVEVPRPATHVNIKPETLDETLKRVTYDPQFRSVMNFPNIPPGGEGEAELRAALEAGQKVAVTPVTIKAVGFSGEVKVDKDSMSPHVGTPLTHRFIKPFDIERDALSDGIPADKLIPLGVQPIDMKGQPLMREAVQEGAEEVKRKMADGGSPFPERFQKPLPCGRCLKAPAGPGGMCRACTEEIAGRLARDDMAQTYEQTEVVKSIEHGPVDPLGADEVMSMEPGPVECIKGQGGGFVERRKDGGLLSPDIVVTGGNYQPEECGACDPVMPPDEPPCGRCGKALETGGGRPDEGTIVDDEVVCDDCSGN